MNLEKLPIRIVSSDKEYDKEYNSKKFKKDWKKFYFTEYSIPLHSVFFCNQCKFRFLADNNTNLKKILELMMRAHSKAHDECPSDSNNVSTTSAFFFCQNFIYSSPDI